MDFFTKNRLNYILWLNIVRNKSSFCKRVNTIHKRATMLTEMVRDKDRRKTWHFEILQNNAKAKNVFENISRPSRRQSVLNSLFIQNISDVLSTGDVAPEILSCGIEITGVKVSPCCKILNVYWQVPPSTDSSDADIALILNQNASKLRAELISRNVLGRVPFIFFLRDSTNAYISAFEKAMKEIDLGPDAESSIIPEDEFIDKLYEFRDSKVEKEGKVPDNSPKESIQTPKETKQTIPSAPPKPLNMKTNIFGLDHEKLMNRVMDMKTKPKFTASNSVVVGNPEGDLFSKIPGTAFYEDVDREELLKKFHIERKKLRSKKTHVEPEDEAIFVTSLDEEHEIETNATDEDFIEEETTERF